ncbi:hypothetical protein ABID56_002584 [Alkalibacillus flavidus]|uniref:Uncharacterized protein n=1 Tax=Alkalibacillus flavidus TaxID=546021 RepID=A0ABV2KXZ6_9BACI
MMIKILSRIIKILMEFLPLYMSILIEDNNLEKKLQFIKESFMMNLKYNTDNMRRCRYNVTHYICVVFFKITMRKKGKKRERGS